MDVIKNGNGLLISCILVACSLVARAETIMLLRDDSGSAAGTPKSFATAGNWSVAVGKTAAEAPNDAYDYYTVYRLSTVNGNNVTVGPFAGRSLTLGSGASLWWFGGSGSTFCPGTDIIAMESGTYFRWTSYGNVAAGTFEIRGAADAPVEMRAWYNNEKKAYTTSFAASFKGNGHVAFDRPAAYYFKHNVNFGTASMSDFFGDLYLCEYINFSATSFTTPGTVVVGTNAVFAGTNAVLNLTATSGNSTFGTLKLGANAFVTLANGHTLTISNSIFAADGAAVECSSMPNVWPAAAVSIPFLTLGPDAELPDNDALAKAVSSRNSPLPHFEFGKTMRGDGGIDVSIDCKEVISQTNSCKGSATLTPYGGTGDPADYFSDGLPISPDKDYYSAKNIYFGAPANVLYEFPGKSLTIGSKCGLYSADRVSFPELNIMPLGFIINMSKYTAGNPLSATLNGKLNFWGGTLRLGGAMTFIVNSDIGGPSNVLFRLSTEKDDTMGGIAELNGDNSGFAQKIVLGEHEADSNLTLRVSSGVGLGGDMAKFTYDGLYVRDTCRLVLCGTNTFAAVNRGWYFKGAGEIVVTNGAQATVKEVVTFDESLRKTGAGALLFGAAPKFFDGEAGTAADVSNGATLTVAEGALGAAATNAFSGLAVTLASGTSYVLPLDTEDASFEERGVDLASQGTSLSFAGPTPLVACASEGFAADGPMLRGVFTVADMPSATALLGKISPQRVVLGDVHLKCTLFARSNEDGTVTVVAKYAEAGLSITFR